MHLFSDIADAIIGFIQNFSGDQLVALLIGLAVLYMASQVVQKGLSIVLSVVGLLLALYFVAPDLYAQVITLAKEAWQGIATVAAVPPLSS